MVYQQLGADKAETAAQVAETKGAIALQKGDLQESLDYDSIQLGLRRSNT